MAEHKEMYKASFWAPSIGVELCQDLVVELKQARTHATGLTDEQILRSPASKWCGNLCFRRVAAAALRSGSALVACLFKTS
jgi:hypothetical protein